MHRIRPQFQNAQNLTLFHTQTFRQSLYIFTYSLCQGIFAHKDPHPPTEISSERQDISEKKTYNILYKPSAS